MIAPSSSGLRNRNDWTERARGLELFPAFGTKLQHIFTAVHVTFLLDDSIIFRAETLTEHLAAPFSHSQETDDGDHYQDRNGGDDYRDSGLDPHCRSDFGTIVAFQAMSFRGVGRSSFCSIAPSLVRFANSAFGSAPTNITNPVQYSHTMRAMPAPRVP